MPQRDPASPNISPLNAGLRSWLFDAVSCGICITDETGVVVDLNRAYCQLHGSSREEVVGRLFATLVADGHHEALGRLQREWVHTGKDSKSSVELLRRDGTTIPVTMSFRPLEVPGGERYQVWSVTDAFPHQQDELRLASVANQIPGVIFRYQLLPDGTDRLLQVSDGARLLWHLEPHEPVADINRLWSRVHPEDIASLRTAIQTSAAELRTWRTDWRVVMEDGSIRWHRGSGTPSRWPDGSTVWDSVVLDVTSEVEAKHRLLQSETRLSTILNAEPECVKIVSRDGTLISMNQAGLEMIEATDRADAALGKAIEGLIHPEDVEVFTELHQNALKGQKGEARFRIRGLKGTQRVTESVSVPLRDSTGDISAVLSITRDITEKHRTQAELERTRKNQEALINTSGDLMWSIDTSLRIITANHAYIEWMRMAVGKELREGDSVPVNGIPDDLRTKWAGYYARALSGDAYIQEEMMQNPATGRIGYWMISFRPITDGSGQITGVACCSRDITHLKEQQFAITAAKRELDKIMDSSKDVICTIDKEGRYVRISKAATALWGYTPSEMMGAPFTQFVCDDDCERTVEAALDIMRGIDVTNFENRYRHRNGSLVPVIWSARWDEGEQLIYAIARDATEKIRAEAALIRSEEQYRALFNSSPLPKWIYQPGDGRILDVNDTAILGYGYSRDEFLGMRIPQLHAPGEPPADYGTPAGDAGVTELIRLGTFTHLRKDGSPVRVELYGRRILFRGSECMLLASNDVTDKERYLAQIEKSEYRLRQATSIARLGYWSLAMNGSTLQWSDEVYLIWGRNRDTFEVSFEAFLETVHPDDRTPFMEVQTAAFAGARVLDFKHRILLPDGTVRWVHELGRLVCDEQGRPVVFEGTVQDITAQKIEEQRLRLMESVVLNANDAVLITEAEPLSEPGPRIVFANQAFTRITGYTLEEVVGKNPRILQGPKTDRVDLQQLGAALRRWESCDFTLLNYRKNGEEFWLQMSISPISDDKGYYTHWIAIERDVTEVKTRELQKHLLADISRVFNEHDALNSAMTAAMELLAHYGTFSFAETWILNGEETAIWLLAQVPHDEAAARFYEHAGDICELRLGEGLPGAVWEQKRVIAWDQVNDRPEFKRRDAAKAAGLQSVLGVPLLSNEELVGVLVVGTGAPLALSFPFHLLLRELQSFLGAEIKRKMLEEQLNQFFNFSPELLCIIGKDGRLRRVNPAFGRLLGYVDSALTGKGFLELVHPEDTCRSGQMINQEFTRHTVQAFENRMRTHTGDYRWIAWSLSAVMPDDALIFAYGTDITETRKLRDLLDKSNRLARVGSWEVDLLQKTVFWSEITREIHEADPDFVPRFDTVQFFKDGWCREAMAQALEEAVQQNKPWDLELIIVTLKGNERWVRIIGNTEFAHGTCVRIYGSFQDIHDRKEAELRITNISNNVPGVLFQYQLLPDGTDRLRYVSQGAQSIWQVTPAQAMEQPGFLWQQMMADEAAAVRSSLRDSAACRQPWLYQWRARLRDGSVRWHEGRGISEEATDGTVIWDMLIIDITEQKELESLVEKTTSMARIGSWEMNLRKGKDNLYWSPMLREILEVDDDYQPTLTDALEFYQGTHRDQMTAAVERLMRTGEEFDLEVMTHTAKGQPLWVRCIGQAEFAEGQCVKVFGSFQDIHSSKLLELRISEILGSISDGFYALDAHWNFTYFNTEAEKLLKRQSADVLGRNIWTEFPAAVGTPIEEVYRRVALSNTPETFEYFFPGDGSWYEVNAYPSNGGICSYFKNIDERRRAAEALRRAYDERDRILESIGDAFFAVDRSWQVTYWNRQAEKIMGQSRGDVLGKCLWDLYPDAVHQEFHRQYHRAIETGEAASFESYYQDLDIWMEVSAYPSEQGLSVFFRDVSIRRRAEEAVRQSNERFQKVAQATNDAIWDWDITQGSLYWGGSFESAFGHHLEDQTSTFETWRRHVHPDDVDAVTQGLDAVVQSPTATNWRGEYRFMKLDGSYAYVIDRGMVIRDASGAAIRMVGAMSDITYRREYEDSLRRLNAALDSRAKELAISNQELEQFAYVASHDLQQPLRMVSSFLTQLDKRYRSQLDDRAREYIRFAVDGAARMRQIILDLLEYSRVGKHTADPERIDMNDLMREVCQLHRHQVDETGARIRIHPLPVIRGHRSPLIQLMNNLVNNALKYRKPDVPVCVDIAARREGDEWIFSVTDNGIGIDPEYKDKIFVIFQRLHESTAYSGTGIGLAIVKKIAESLGGRVWVESLPGAGSTFFVALKAIAPPTQAAGHGD